MRLENTVLSILNDKKKIFLVYLITLILFVLAILSFPTNILKARSRKRMYWMCTMEF